MADALDLRPWAQTEVFDFYGHPVAVTYEHFRGERGCAGLCPDDPEELTVLDWSAPEGSGFTDSEVAELVRCALGVEE